MEISRVSNDAIEFKVSVEELYRRWGITLEDILMEKDNTVELINQFVRQAMQLLTDKENVRCMFSVRAEYVNVEDIFRIIVTKEKEKKGSGTSKSKSEEMENEGILELPFYTEGDVLPDSIRTKNQASADLEEEAREYKESFLYVFKSFCDLVSACNQVKDDGIISHLIMEGECFALLLYAEDTAALKKAGLNLSEFAIKQYKVNDYETAINKSDLLIKNTAISVICKEMS